MQERYGRDVSTKSEPRMQPDNNRSNLSHFPLPLGEG